MKDFQEWWKGLKKELEEDLEANESDLKWNYSPRF